MDVTPLTAEEIDSADFDDLGTIMVDEVPREGIRAGDDRPPGKPSPAPEPDEPPAHARKRRRSKPEPVLKRAKISVGIRTDINAKISMPLEIGGQIWYARDPLCGGRFLQQRPAIADAFTNIVCDSPDLIAFFTGPGSWFMKYLELGAACWPVFEMIGAHHVYHSVEIPVSDHREMPHPARAA